MRSDRQRRAFLPIREKKDLVFLILLGVVGFYYIWRMFALTPWYDELYTYYCFISKGPLYAAVHWPLPNNHVGYSVLSACLDYLGNSCVGLRGVSFLAALANMILLYKIAGRYLKGWLDLAVVSLYVSMNLVNQQAVQGRGYTLGICCFLTAFYGMVLICERERVARRIYVLYISSLVLGLYAVSSNVYWVVPLCMGGGCYLLLEKRFQRFGKLVAASLVAAAGTVFLYATIWAAIGSNLLVKDEASSFFGMGHVKMILSAPFAAVGRGMEYMLATPYIQSEERIGFGKRLWEWLQVLSGSFVSIPGQVVLPVFILGVAFLLWKLARGFREKEGKERLLYLVLLVEILFVPACLLIQCKRPYYRVFTYGGVLLSLLVGVLMQGVWEGLEKRSIHRGIGPAAFLLVAAMVVKGFFFSGYQEQYGLREHEIAQAFRSADIDPEKKLCVTDCNQEYLLFFLHGIRCESREIEGADMVLLDKRMMDPDFDEMIWEFYHYYDSIPWDYIEENMTSVYENDDYVLFER